MRPSTLFALVATLATAALAAPAPSPKLSSVPAHPAAAITRQTDPDWTYYDTEAICLAAGWDYCRSYAVDVGVTKWVGFKGEQPVCRRSLRSCTALTF